MTATLDLVTATASPAAEPAVALRGVSKRFRDGPLVLEGLDLVVAPGEFLTMVGASGCGKTTLLSMVAGLEQPSRGSVEVAGDRAALVFQEHALFAWLTAGENIALALRLRGVPKKDRAAEVQRLLALVRLEGHERTRVHELSGGMRQRVAIARALAQDARVLLLDEPFAALDAITRDLLHEELVRLWSDLGLTVLFVTHNVREAARLGQRLVLLGSRPGRVLREWTVEIPQPRRIEDAAVGALARDVTAALQEEIRRHGDRH
jgi:NitT/TauT family transport system ATP-binding protein